MFYMTVSSLGAYFFSKPLLYRKKNKSIISLETLCMHTQYLDNLDGLNRQKQVQEAGTNPFILIMQAPVKRNF